MFHVNINVAIGGGYSSVAVVEESSRAFLAASAAAYCLRHAIKFIPPFIQVDISRKLFHHINRGM